MNILKKLTYFLFGMGCIVAFQVQSGNYKGCYLDEAVYTRRDIQPCVEGRPLNVPEVQNELRNAINSYNIETVANAIKRGADVNMPASNGELPIITSVQSVSREWSTQRCADKSVPILILLLTHGADVNKKDNHSSASAMAMAITRLDPGLVELFLQYGGNSNPLLFVLRGSHGIRAQAWLERQLQNRYCRITQEILENLRKYPRRCGERNKNSEAQLLQEGLRIIRGQ